VDEQAVDIGDDWLERFRTIAVELDMGVVITYLQRWRAGPRNAATLIDRTGAFVATYAKVHTCDFSMEAALTPGDAFHVASLSTAKGRSASDDDLLRLEFPESARALMLDGAEVILTPNACELNEDRIGQFRTRAFENMVAVAMTNYPAPHCNGHSCAFDGVAYLSDDTTATTRSSSRPEPGVVFADVDLDLLRQYRKNEVWRRVPKAVRIRRAGSGTASEPFRRRDSRRVRPPHSYRLLDSPRAALPPLSALRGDAGRSSPRRWWPTRKGVAGSVDEPAHGLTDVDEFLASAAGTMNSITAGISPPDIPERCEHVSSSSAETTRRRKRSRCDAEPHPHGAETQQPACEVDALATH